MLNATIATGSNAKKKPRRTLSQQTVKFVDEFGDAKRHENAFHLSNNATDSFSSKRMSLFGLDQSNTSLLSLSNESIGTARRYSLFIDSSDGFVYSKPEFIDDCSLLERTNVTDPPTIITSPNINSSPKFDNNPPVDTIPKVVDISEMEQAGSNEDQSFVKNISANGQNSCRRLSSGQKRLSRRRASSLLGSNLYTLHPAVEPTSYYKHISSDLPGPLRMRQLLIWCLQTGPSSSKWQNYDQDMIISNLSSSTSSILKEDLIVEGVLEAIIDGLVKKQIQTTWYHVPIKFVEDKSISPDGPLRPNPANDRVLRELSSLTSFNNKVEHEFLEWDNCVSLLSSSVTSATADVHLAVKNSFDVHEEEKDLEIPGSILQCETFVKGLLSDFGPFIEAFSFKANF